MWSEALLSFALTLSSPEVHHRSETFDEAVARLGALTQGIGVVSEEATCTDQPATCRRIWPASKYELGVALVMIAWFESGFQRRIALDQCRPLECDARLLADGRSVPQARSYFQLHLLGSMTPQVWRALVGEDFESAYLNALWAAKALSAQYNRCGRGIPGAVSGFATGGACNFGAIEPRMTVFNRGLRAVATWEHEHRAN